MPKKGRKPKPFFDEMVECPWCHKKSKVKAIKKTITPATKAEIEIEVTVEKQQDLKGFKK